MIFQVRQLFNNINKSKQKDQLSQIPNSLSGECQSVGKPTYDK